MRVRIWCAFVDEVIDRGQALGLGITPQAIDRLVRDGQWQRLRRGVHLTHPDEPSRSAVLWAAVRYVGPGGPEPSDGGRTVQDH